MKKMLSLDSKISFYEIYKKKRYLEVKCVAYNNNDAMIL